MEQNYLLINKSLFVFTRLFNYTMDTTLGTKFLKFIRMTAQKNRLLFIQFKALALVMTANMLTF